MATLKKESSKKEKEVILPNIPDGHIVRITKIDLIDSKTSPPPRYTEGSLINDMSAAAKFIENNPEYRKIMNEVKGLGSAATRDAFIETLKDNKYLLLDSKKSELIPTEKAMGFIEWLEQINPMAIDVCMTTEWEAKFAALSKMKDTSMAVKEFNESIRGYIERFVTLAQSNPPRKDDNMSEQNNAPSENQLKFAKMISTKLGIPLPDEVMVDRQACSAFIDQNQAQAVAPSAKQINFANAIATRKKLKVPDDALKNGKLLSAWIDENKD